MWYKGTKEQCQGYDQMVCLKDGISKPNNWYNAIEIDGDFYILKHPKHEFGMVFIEDIPSQNITY